MNLRGYGSIRRVLKAADALADDLVVPPAHQHDKAIPMITVISTLFQWEVKPILIRMFRYRGDKAKYLRHIGVKIGSNCDIITSVKNFGTEPWLIEVGNNVTLTSGVVLLTHDGSSRLFRQTLPGSSKWGNRFGTIRIDDNCFVGYNSIVMPGVHIGHDSIVGAGSVVTKDVAPRMVVAGVPARPICTLDQYIERYVDRMIPIEATTREQLRRELTQKLWGEAR